MSYAWQTSARLYGVDGLFLEALHGLRSAKTLRLEPEPPQIRRFHPRRVQRSVLVFQQCSPQGEGAQEKGSSPI